MGTAYSQDLRERVMGAVDGGLGAYEVAPLLRVSVSYIYKALGRRRVTGETTARPSGRGPSPKLAPYDDALRQRIADEPDGTLNEIQAWLFAAHAIKVSIGCLWKRLRHLQLPLKKSRSEPPNKIATMSPRRARNGAPIRPI